METKEKTLSFGRYLQAARIERNITLEQISRETRIHRDILAGIEKEDHDRLPDEVFVKGFLRAYAKAIGANGDEAVNRYLKCQMLLKKIAAVEVDLVKSQSGYWRRLVVSIGVFAIIIFLSIYGFSHLWGEKHPAPMPKPDAPLVEKAPVDEPVKPEVQGKSVTPVKQTLKSLSLKIVAVEDSWVKVIIDEQDSKEYSLKNGDQLQLNANSGYNILVGNAGGVKLILNDKPIDISGKSGQVVNVQLP